MTANELLALGAATLGEAGAVPMAPRISRVWSGAIVAGPALPVRCPGGDNLAVHVAVTRANAGDVLVVDASEAPEVGYWGEVLTTAAEVAGIVGLIIDGGVRDVAALAAHRFPVFSTGIALPGASKDGPGAVGEPVHVGGAQVSPGDWVVGDGDGVVVVPGDQLAAVMTAGRERAERESALFERLRAGRTTIELLDLNPDGL